MNTEISIHNQQPISRKDAQQSGEQFYFTGNPCIRGHVARRRTKDKRCVACDREKSTARYHNGEKLQRATKRRVKLSDPEYIAERDRRRAESLRRSALHDSITKAEKYRSDPIYREKVLQRNRDNHAKNPASTTARVTRRRLAKIKRTPTWLTEEMCRQIREIYVNCRLLSDLTGVAHEVDHIVPLQGKLVSGLHVPWNLRVVPKRVNRSKHASFELNPL